jgi:hypothetical protein
MLDRISTNQNGTVWDDLPMPSCTLEYTPELVQRVALGYVARHLGWSGLAALLVVIAGASYQLVTEPGTFATGLVAGIAALVVVGLVMLVVLALRQSRRRFGRLGPERRARLTLTEEQFQLESAAGTAAIPWASFTDLWVYRDFWLLFVGPGQYLTLPLDSLDAEARDWIRSRVTPRHKSVPSQP